MIRWGVGLTLACVFALPPSNVQAQQSNKRQNQKANYSIKDLKPQPGSKVRGKNTQRTKPAKTPAKVPASRKPELMQLVRKHHPELEQLLNSLEKNRPAKYESAMLILDRDFSRIEAIADQPERQKSALRQWKLKSRIDLLAARTVLNDTPERRKQLRDLIQEHLAEKTRQLKAERNRINQRLKRVNQQLDKLEEGDAEVERQVNQAIRKVRNAFGMKKKKTPRKKNSKEKNKNSNGGAKPKAPSGSKNSKAGDKDSKATSNTKSQAA